MIGGGRSGREAARAAAAAGRQVVLVDERGAVRARTASSRCSRPARALGIYEGGLVPVDAGSVLYRFRAERIVVATGALEQPLVFPGQRPRRRLPPGGRAETRRRLVAEARRTRGDRVPPTTAGSRSPTSSSAPASRSSRASTSARLRRGNSRRDGRRGRLSSVVVDGREHRLRPARRVGRPPAGVLAARSGRGADRVRRRPRDLRARPTCRRTSRRSGPSPGTSSPRRCLPPASTPPTRRAAASSASARTSPRRT